MFLNNLKKNLNTTTTTNGDVAYLSTLNANLDFFAGMSTFNAFNTKAKDLLLKAFQEDNKLALRNLFHLRSVRDGKGRRMLFKESLKTLFENDLIKPEKTKELLDLVMEYGRADDFLVLFNNKKCKPFVVDFIKEELHEDLNTKYPTLLAKWLPSINATNKEKRLLALNLAKALKMSNKDYRKTLSALRSSINIIENALRTKSYSEIDYAKVPGRAFKSYYRLFMKYDKERFEAFLNDKTTVVKTDTIYPHEIISEYVNNSYYTSNIEYNNVLEKQWQSLDRDALVSKSNTIVVRDGSGSMYNSGANSPINVADALSILFSEMLPGEFKDKFITFSRSPKLVDLSGYKTLIDKIKYTRECNEISNTDITKVYELIFNTQKETPTEHHIDRIIIISDMQFDGCVEGLSTYDNMCKMFIDSGMKVPEVVFWNVDENKGFPVSKYDNVKLVNGYDVSTLKAILADETPDAISFMLNVLESYSKVDSILE